MPMADNAHAHSSKMDNEISQHDRSTSGAWSSVAAVIVLVSFIWSRRISDLTPFSAERSIDLVRLCVSASFNLLGIKHGRDAGKQDRGICACSIAQVNDGLGMPMSTSRALGKLLDACGIDSEFSGGASHHQWPCDSNSAFEMHSRTFVYR